MPDMNKLILFDVDKTLIKSSKGHLEAFSTGIYSKEQLESAGADFTVENLEDKDKILEILKLVNLGIERKT